MTDKLRKAAAERFRELLDQRMLRKQAVILVRQEFTISRTSLYEYCARFGVSTR